MDAKKGWRGLAGDGNQDGWVSLAEFTAGLKQLGVTTSRLQSQAEALFRGVDAAGQGAIAIKVTDDAHSTMPPLTR